MWNKVVRQEGCHRNSHCPPCKLWPLFGLQPSLCETFPYALLFVEEGSVVPDSTPRMCSVSHYSVEAESALTHGTTSSISTPRNNPSHSADQTAEMGVALPPTHMFLCPWVSHFLSLGFTSLLARYRELDYQRWAHFFYKGPDNKYFRLYSPYIWICNNSNLPLQCENTQIICKEMGIAVFQWTFV